MWNLSAESVPSFRQQVSLLIWAGALSTGVLTVLSAAGEHGANQAIANQAQINEANDQTVERQTLLAEAAAPPGYTSNGHPIAPKNEYIFKHPSAPLDDLQREANNQTDATRALVSLVIMFTSMGTMVSSRKLFEEPGPNGEGQIWLDRHIGPLLFEPRTFAPTEQDELDTSLTEPDETTPTDQHAQLAETSEERPDKVFEPGVYISYHARTTRQWYAEPTQLTELFLDSDDPEQQDRIKYHRIRTPERVLDTVTRGAIFGATFCAVMAKSLSHDLAVKTRKAAINFAKGSRRAAINGALALKSSYRNWRATLREQKTTYSSADPCPLTLEGNMLDYGMPPSIHKLDDYEDLVAEKAQLNARLAVLEAQRLALDETVVVSYT